jgi:acetyltransferase-like isoleucine patch superfamily enzyme
MQDVHQRIETFLSSREPFVEFALECSLEERIRYVRRMLAPHLSQTRLNVNFCFAKIAEIIPLSSVKIAIYRALGVTIGTGVYISPDVILDPHFPSLITLDDYCVLGWGAKIGTHEMSTAKYRIGRVTVGRGAVVGAFSMIRAGVAIGEGAQTVVNSFIHKDVPANHAGKPTSPQ